jgi:indolepyruvate ferredoxin oxidoreductase beta subunit
MASQMGLPVEVWQTAIKETVPPKFLEMNLKAFDSGFHNKNKNS